MIDHKKKRKFTISEVTTPRWSFEEDVIGYHDLGIDTIEVWESKLLEYGIEKGIELLEKYSMQVSMICPLGGQILHSWPKDMRLMGCPFPLPNCPKWKRDLSELERIIDSVHLASRLDANGVWLMTGGQGTYSRQDAVKLIVKLLYDIMGEAEDKKVKIALQPTHKKTIPPGVSIITDIPSTMEIINQVSHKNLGMYFDICHLWDTPGIMEQIPKVIDKIFGVQISDWKPTGQDISKALNNQDDRQMLGDGIIPIRNLLHALDNAGYEEVYALEILAQETVPGSPWTLEYRELINKSKETFDQLWTI